MGKTYLVEPDDDGEEACTLDAAFLANPNRFKNKRPKLPAMPTAAWINPPPEEKNPTSEPVAHTLN